MTNRFRFLKVSFLCFIAIALLFISGPAIGDVKVGALNDMTGATSDVGKDYALGIAEAYHYVNDHGGINGKKIKIYQFDYGYRIPEALTKYNLFKRLKCVLVQGWGTGDTEALSPTVAKDKMPYVSASYSAHLTDPKKTPYNLFFSADYSTMARATLTAWFDTVWSKSPDKDKRKPRLICSYMFASPYCSAPIKAIKDQAKLLGFEVGEDQDVSLFALDAKSQVLAMKKFEPDVVWHGNTAMSVATTIRDEYSLGLKASNITNIWGMDENLPMLAGEAAEGVMAAASCAYFGMDVPVMDDVKKYAKKYNPGIPEDKRLIRTVQGWCNVLVATEAMIRADKAGDLTGEGILKKGFETMRDFALGLGANPVTYTETDHRPTSKVKVYTWSGGKFSMVEDVDLQKRWPDQWANEWLGW